MNNVSENVDIPIIIVHKGNHFYLKKVIKQIRLFNKNNPIYLLGDKYNKKTKDVNHYFISDYFLSAKEFEKKYIHMSSNLYGYELFCFQRWFIINEFVNEKKLHNFLCLDSDVLIYCNISEFFSEYLKYDHTTCSGWVPCFSLFSSISIHKFCNYITELYTKPEYISRLKQRYNNEFYRKKPGGNSDMTAFEFYPKDVSSNVFDLVIPHNGVFWDENISLSNGFEVKNGLKNIYWINDIPHCKSLQDGKLIRALGLHFQGKTKFIMYKYVLHSNLKRDTSIIYYIFSILEFKLILAKLERYKRGIKKLILKITHQI